MCLKQYGGDHSRYKHFCADPLVCVLPSAQGAFLSATQMACGPVSCVVAGDVSSPVAGAPPQSPFMTSPVGVESLLGSPLMSPRKPPRKIPRAPYKVSSLSL